MTLPYRRYLFSLIVIIISLLFVTPFIYSNNMYNGVINAKQIWLYAIMALLMLVTGLNLLFSKPYEWFTFNRIDIALLLFYCYIFLRAASTQYMPLLQNTRFINYSLCTIFYFVIRYIIAFGSKPANNIKRLNLTQIFIPLIIFSGLGQAIWGLLQLYNILPGFHRNFTITGTFFNPAPYALYLSVVFPMALTNVLFKNKPEGINNENINDLKGSSKVVSFFYFNKSSLTYYLSLATVIAILLVLPLIMIRAAWLGTLAGTLVVFQYKYQYLQHIKLLLKSPMRRFLIVVLTLALAVLLGAGTYFFKKDSADGKLFIWEVTIGKIVQKPLFGYGVGRFEAEYNYWQADYFLNHPEEIRGSKGKVAGDTKYAFNDFLEMGSELGLTGLLLFLAVITSVFLGVKRFESPEFIGSFNKILYPSFLVLLCIAAVSFPLYNVPLLLLFFTVLALISANTTGIKIPEKITAIFTYSTVIILFIGSIHISKALPEIYKSYNSWQQANLLYEMKIYDSAEKKYEAAYPVLKYNGDYLQYFGKCYAMNNNYYLAQDLLTRARQFGGDCILYTTLGDIYKETKQYVLAESMYKMAARMMPEMLYPDYLLAKLYVITGERQKALQQATEGLNRNLKFESMATKEMKTEMKNIINEISKLK
jgi:O-antigen polymerase